MEVVEKPSSEIKTANDWIRESKKRPIPEALFGEFWREGETAVLFADTGMGKSALAMQIAQSIASGIKIKPFRLAVKPHKVLYLDLEMNDKQFEARHAADHEGGRQKFLRKHFVFSDNLCREELDPADLWVRGEKTSDVFRRKLRQLVKQYDAKVVIIDSLTCLKRSYYGSREILDLITAVKRLQREMNISVLALVQTPKQAEAQPLSVNSLRGMKLLCSRADSVFGIGQSRFDTFGRYIKRVKSLGDAIDFDSMHVPTFRLKKLGGNFLGFEFQGFMPEVELLSDIRASREWTMIEKIKQMRDGGMSFRAIAAEISLPTTTVHRLLQMWRPPVEQQTEAKAVAVYDPKMSPFYFPGREEYDEAGRDPKFDCLYADESEENYRLRREAYQIESATAKAREEYKKTGKTPKLAEMLARMNGSEPGAIATGFPMSDGGIAADTSLERNGKPQAFRTSSGEAAAEPENPIGIPGLEHTLDGNGKDIWVQERNERGKHTIWYDLDSKGRRRRMVRDANGIGITQMDRIRDDDGIIIY